MVPFHVVVLGAVGLDLLLGDPQNPLHPMRLIGRLISWGIEAYRKLRPSSKVTQFVLGGLVTSLVVGLVFWLTWWLVTTISRWNQLLGQLVQVILGYFCLATTALKRESLAVYQLLKAGDLAAARKRLAWIVGRDTEPLDETGIVKAAVETVAENLSDGVIAPLMYFSLGGAPLALAYKAINTLDSMIGYRSAEFRYFGKMAARLDDGVNFVPARLSAGLMLLVCPILGLDGRAAWRIFWRDRFRHLSPNSAQTESVCAGALGICLGGANYYHGQLVEKPIIGDCLRPAVAQDIVTTNHLMMTVSLVATALAWLGLFLLT